MLLLLEVWVYLEILQIQGKQSRKFYLRKNDDDEKCFFFFFFSCQSASHEKHNVWYLDCGCSNHML